jgi:CheY-like chemotaxis protein
MMARAKKILIVDDDESFVDSNRELLEAYGYEVHTAYDGESGLSKARQVRPDLMILDVMMAHDTEGFEIARKIQKEPELTQMKLLLVSGITREMKLPFKLTPDSTWLPVNRVLEKPIDPARLIREIGKMLQGA